MTPPALTDGNGWPFKLLGRVPYRPDNHDDWRDGIFRAWGWSAELQAELVRSFHGGDNAE